MYSIAWIITFLLLLFIEIMTVNLVSIWFVLGAIAAYITSLHTNTLWIQFAVFALVSVLALLIMSPFMKRVRKREVTPTNSDRVIGKVGEVTKKIHKNQYGEVKVFGNTWTACSDHSIDVGEKVRVVDIDGVKLVVEEEDN